MSFTSQDKAPLVVTQAAIDAALQRARIERANAVHAIFAGLFAALRRLTVSAPAQTLSTAAR